MTLLLLFNRSILMSAVIGTTAYVTSIDGNNGTQYEFSVESDDGRSRFKTLVSDKRVEYTHLSFGKDVS